MLLALNIGNSGISFGVWDPERENLRFTAELASRPDATADEYAVLLSQIFALRGFDAAQITDVIVSSVVPALLDTLLAAVRSFTDAHPLVVGPGMRTGLQLRIDSPAQLGADLVALAAGARHSGAHCPAVVISLETATTLTVLDADGAVCGVVILPGLGSSAAALERDAAQLAQIPLTPPRRVIGRNTAESIRAGLFWGSAAQIDGLCDRIEAELGLESGELTVLVTGSYADRVMPLCRRPHAVREQLIFEGLLALFRAHTQRKNEK